MKSKLVEKLHTLLSTNLVAQCPYLSGNMGKNISTTYYGEHTARIRIAGRFYDTNRFKKDGTIVFKNTQENIKAGIRSYAMWVNELGGFATHNDSEHWVNRACYDTVKAIADEIGAVVINKLPL